MITSSRGLSFDRVVFFSDAVFAFAITLLLIDLRPPNVPAPEFEAALRAFFGQPGPFVATAIGFLVRNEDQRSKDYAAIAQKFRPGHADYTYWQKYGVRDARGGGRASARETVGL